MEIQPDLSVCLVANNKPETLSRFLDALFTHADPVSFEVIVVDNLAHPETGPLLEREFAGVTFFENGVCEPQPAARNHAFRLAQGRYISFWDPELILRAKSLFTLLRFLDDTPDVGIAAPRIVSPEGEVLPTPRTFPTLQTVLLQSTGGVLGGTSALQQHLYAEHDHLLGFECDWLLGTCLVIRREVLEEIGPFDDGFHSGLAAADYCLRARRSGWHIFYRADAVIQDERPQLYAPLPRGQEPGRAGDATRFLLKKWLKSMQPAG